MLVVDSLMAGSSSALWTLGEPCSVASPTIPHRASTSRTRLLVTARRSLVPAGGRSYDGRSTRYWSRFPRPLTRTRGHDAASGDTPTRDGEDERLPGPRPGRRERPGAPGPVRRRAADLG